LHVNVRVVELQILQTRVTARAPLGANGALTGYGGGLERQRWLLTHEGVEVR